MNERPEDYVAPFKVKSAELLYRLREKMARTDVTTKELAGMFGVSYPHAIALMSGERWWASCDRSVIEAIAKFLEVPVLQVFFWAGFLDAEDQLFTNDLEARCYLTYRKMADDPYVMSVVPPPGDWNDTPISVKLALTMLYEALSARQLMDHATTELSDDKLASLGLLHKKRRQTN